jgi:hypothetical protein
VKRNQGLGVPKKPDGKQVVLVEGPRGGKLRRGGPSPGSGRKPSAIKALALLALDEALPRMAQIAKGDGTDAVAAFNALAKVSGVDGRISPADVRERLKAQVEVIRSRASWTPDELLTALGEVWR